jgi:hypothetical protein
MNVFALDHNPIEAARCLCDEDLKYALQSGVSIVNAVNGGPYNMKKDHPCIKWAAANIDQYYWLIDYLKEVILLCEKSNIITNNRRDIIYAYERPLRKLPVGRFRFVMIMDEIYKHMDTVFAYQRYYKNRLKKMEIVTYTNRKIPRWLNDLSNIRR